MRTENNVPASEPAVPAVQPKSLLETELLELGPLSWRGVCGVVALAAAFAVAFGAFLHQLRHGLAVTAMNDYFSWGVYIINFVFFIGISMAGSLISAILRLTGAEWRKPITRMAEGITVFALIVAAFMIVVDMGRPDRFLYTIIYGRVQSPILWDVFSLSTYLAGSILFLYLPLIPDFAILRDQGERFAPWRRRLYEKLALGWRGTPEQHLRLERIMMVMSIAIIPVAVSIHTVTAWIFGMTLRPGWHSTIIGPDFVVGALYSGIAAVITIMAILRRVYHLENFVTVEHFKKLSWLLFASGVAYAYFMVNEYMGAAYTNEKTERELVSAILHGSYAVQFQLMVAVGLLVPAILLVLPGTRNMAGIVTASVLVNIGMWLKRYIIVVPTLSSTFLPMDLPPEKELSYIPTWVEWAITAGGFACFALMYVAFSKLVPVISVWEMQATPGERSAKEAQPKSVAQNTSGWKSTVGVILMIGIAAAAFTPRALLAAEPTTTNTVASHLQPIITLKLSTEEGKKVIVATVKTNDKPVEGAKVAFTVKRTFGELPIGAEDTLDDGTAAVPFPVALPGDAQGYLQVIAEIKGPKAFEGTRFQAPIEGGKVIPLEKNPFPRALWSPRAPATLLIIIFLLLGAAWGTYAYVVFQLIQIKKGSKP